jgi:hypothetical protein
MATCDRVGVRFYEHTVPKLGGARRHGKRSGSKRPAEDDEAILGGEMLAEISDPENPKGTRT